MSVKKYRVKLTTEERQELKALVSRGRAAAYKQTHARVLLLSDAGQGDGAMKDEEIARALQDWLLDGGTGAPPLRGGGCRRGLGTQGANPASPEEAGRSGGSPPRIQYGAGSGCPGLRRTAAGTGELDAEIVGGPAGRMRDSGPHQP